MEETDAEEEDLGLMGHVHCHSVIFISISILIT